jgi:D-3-phosphoglycerate dehydrogenase / 2-oxoglutarate reductase
MRRTAVAYTVIRGVVRKGFDTSIEEERRILGEVGAELEVVQVGERERLLEMLPRADGLLGLSQLNRDLIACAERARGIVTVSHGFNFIDLEAATEAGLPVSNVYFCHREVANHTLMLLLAWARKLIPLHNSLVEGHWRPDLQPPVPPLYGEALGLIGFGHIGREVARRARGFDLQVLAFDPYVSEAVAAEHEAELVELDELLRRSDYVSIHAPSNTQTRRIVGERELALMKPSAAIFNTARGDLIDEQALYRALVEGRIAGAGLDVFEREPTASDNPLLKLENVIVTPHAAGYSEAAIRDGYRQGAVEMVNILSGRWPRNVINSEVRGRTRVPFV